MKKLLLSLIIAINLVLSPVAVASEYMSSNVNIPLLTLTILAGLFIIEVLFYYFHKIYLQEKNENDISIALIEKMSLLDKFNVALETRNLEIELFWKRSNYFLVLNTAIAVGFFSFIEKYINMEWYIYALLFCAIGLVVCLVWFKVNLGSKFWQSHWEQILTETSGNMGLDYFAKSDKNTIRVMNNLESPKPPTNPFEKYYNHLVLEKPSVSKWMTFLSFFFLLVWFFIGGFISYKIGEIPIGVNALIIWIFFWLAVRVIFVLFKIISKFISKDIPKNTLKIISKVMIWIIITSITLFFIYGILNLNLAL